MKRSYKKCEKCERQISSSNFQKHLNCCCGPKIKKIRGIDFDPNSGYVEGSRKAWNKGKTKESDSRIAQAAETFKQRIKEGKIKFKKSAWSQESRRKLSESMKIAHSEGRAWNIGKSRWNNKPSYPETFFIKVVENEFLDKEYIREFPMGIYSLDFAWPHLKKAIEIDGDQHERFQECIDRDKRKDNLITENGWSLLRIRWKDLFNEPKYFIKKTFEFIHSDI